MSDIFTRKMLSKIRSTQCSSPVDLPRENTITESDNINTRFRILMEEATASNDTGKSFTISSNDTQFGSVRQAQEKMLKTTIPGVTLKPDALVYYPNLDNLVLNGSIESLGITFQFKYRDSSGDGCYIWAEGVQMTSENVTTIEKLRSAFENWRQSIEKDGELMEELKKWSMKE
jgi:hypothetical protein